MNTIIGLSYIAAFPILATLILCILNKKTGFGKLQENKKQIIYGLIFGALAVLGTEFGVDVGGATANTRDAAVLTASLVFGTPAGIMAGVIGGVERYIAVLWGAGTYTRMACSLSTLLAGLFGASLRKRLFNNKRPSVFYAFAIGVVTEVLHMLMIFITNMQDIETAFVFVQKCSIPMISVNGVAVMFSVFIAGIAGDDKLSFKVNLKGVSVIAQRWLINTVVIAFVITCVFTSVLQVQISDNNTENLLRLNLSDVVTDISEAPDTVIRKERIAAAARRRIGQTGKMVISRSFDNRIPGSWPEGKQFSSTLYGDDAYCMYMTCEGYYIVAVLPVSEATTTRNLAIYMMVFMEIVMFTALFVVIFFLIKHQVVDNIESVNEKLAEITDGNLDVKVDCRTNEEFSTLSDDINETVDTLKQYIEDAAARLDKELELAKVIQSSSLPSIFPPFPAKKELDIFATMDAAREVGGDFYDFYMLDDNHVAFLVADVSGKGITGAMFMMKAKTIIKSFAEHCKSAAEILTRANEALCEGNDAEMFVTCFLAILDLENKKLEYANAGHNPPLLKRQDGSFEYFKVRPGFVLGGMEGVRYRSGEIEFNKGDSIFLYTDGVTEATNNEQELYGEERLLATANATRIKEASDLCAAVKVDMDLFVEDAPQFDDITMLCVRLIEPPSERFLMDELTIDAEVSNVEAVTDFVNEQLEKLEAPMKAQAQIDVAIDELFANIAHYAYYPDKGQATIRVEQEKDPKAVVISFIDRGMEFDPLAKDDPDVTLAAEERGVGGLGIFIVKKNMDDVSYEYKDEQNILTIKKYL